MRYKSASLYTTYEEWNKLIRKLMKQLSAEARSRKRRPEPTVVLISVPLPEEPIFDGDYG